MIHTLTLAWTRNGETIADSVNLEIEGEQNLDVPVGPGVINKQVLCTIDVSALGLVYIRSDQTITLKTNSTSAPDETITISAAKPFLWYLGCGWVNDLETDIITLYLSNAGEEPAKVQIRYGYDATP